MVNRLGPRRGPSAELGDHRIVEHADLAALEDAGVVAHGTRRRRLFHRGAVAGQTTDGRQEAAIGILGIKARFDGPAVDLQIALPKG